MLISGTKDGVHLPMTNLAALLSCPGSLGDVPFSVDAATLFIAAVPLSVSQSLTKEQPQVATTLLVLPDVFVDRFVADLEKTFLAQPATDLLGAEQVSEQALDQRPVGGEKRVFRRDRERRPLACCWATLGR